ncbi:MAG: heparinase II/III family protein [Clostridia bacterium]|nr:heparinase II/III family protein [Clostridia bacterium]
MEKKNYLKECNEQKWQEVRSHPYFERVRTEAIELAEKLLLEEPLPLRFSDYHKFVTEGSRKPYGARSGQYTKRMSAFFFAYMLTKDEKYIEPLVDVMWQICDMETWSSNAHVKEEAPIIERRRFLDLVSCGIGYMISEILYYVGDKFPELAYRRIKEEVRFRIIDCYREKRGETDFWWYKASNNWSAVCISMVFGCFVYLAEKEEIDAELPRFLATAQCFIDGIPDDGCCLEGKSYWDYGFSHYCVFAEFMREYTDGAIDLFKDEKVRRIAKFPSLVMINDHQCLSFSDAGSTYAPSAWLTHFLKNVYPEMEIPPIAAPGYTPRWLQYVLWADPKLTGAVQKPKSHIFREAQWFLHVGDKYAVGAKAGKNHEPHNHNDIGSFIISKDNNITFADPGSGEYVKTYFGAGRYTHLVTSARGHSVPVINGYLQCTGEEKLEPITMEEGRFTFHVEQGYPDALREKLSSFVRDFDCTPDALILTDSFSFTEEPTSLVEQFVSLTPIEGENGLITCGASRLTYDADLFDMELTSESFRRNNGKEETLYILKLSARTLDKELSFSFRFD